MRAVNWWLVAAFGGCKTAFTVFFWLYWRFDAHWMKLPLRSNCFDLTSLLDAAQICAAHV